MRRLNGEHVAHLWNYGDNTWGWEGNYKGDDFDYNDLVVQIDFTSDHGERMAGLGFAFKGGLWHHEPRRTTARSFLALLLFLMLFPASAGPAADSDPVALIKAIYATYETDNPGLEHIYSNRLQALIDKDTKETPDGMVGRIDWDVFVNGQDWKLSKLKITLVSQDTDRAQVRATFKNFDDTNNMLFNLVRENGAWRVDDIENTLPPRWTMSKILTDAPDAFPDAKQDDTPKQN